MQWTYKNQRNKLINHPSIFWEAWRPNDEHVFSMYNQQLLQQQRKLHKVLNMSITILSACSRTYNNNSSFVSYNEIDAKNTFFLPLPSKIKK